MGASFPRANVLLAVLAAAVALVAHANSLHGPFTFDDRTEIVENRSIEDLGQPLTIIRHSLTRPLVNLSYAVDYAVWGGRDVFGFHLTNLLLHLANVVLLFWLVRGLADDAVARLALPSTAAATWTAFVAASLFAVHPTLTEAVSYVSSRSELLSGAFFLSALLCFRRQFAGGGVHWLAAGLASFVLAAASKETAAMLPLVLVVLDRLLGRGSAEEHRARLWHLHLPLLTLVAAGAAARVWLYVGVEQTGAAGFDWRHVLLTLHVFVRYVELFFAPVSQTIVHEVVPVESAFDVRVIVATLIIGLFVVLAFTNRRQHPLVAFGLAWFGLVLLPSAAIILLASRGQPMAEHRVYLASAGFFMAAGTAATRLVLSGVLAPTRHRVVAAVLTLAAVLGALSWLTIERNRVWSDPVRLWGEAAERAPRAWTAQYGFGHALQSAGDCERAESAYQRAMAILPNAPEAYLALAACQVDRGHARRAAETLRLALLQIPSDTAGRLLLAAIEEEVFRDPDQALRLCREALALAPDLETARACVTRLEGAGYGDRPGGIASGSGSR